MVSSLAPFVRLVTMALAAVAAAIGAVQLPGDRPSNALVYFAIAAGTWGFGQAISMAMKPKKPIAKPSRA